MSQMTCDILRNSVDDYAYENGIIIDDTLPIKEYTKRQYKSKLIYSWGIVCTECADKNNWDSRMSYHSYYSYHYKKKHKEDFVLDANTINHIKVVSQFKPLDNNNKRYQYEYRFVDTISLSPITPPANNNLQPDINNNHNNNNHNDNNHNDNTNDMDMDIDIDDIIDDIDDIDDIDIDDDNLNDNNSILVQLNDGNDVNNPPQAIGNNNDNQMIFNEIRALRNEMQSGLQSVREEINTKLDLAKTYREFTTDNDIFKIAPIDYGSDDDIPENDELFDVEFFCVACRGWYVNRRNEDVDGSNKPIPTTALFAFGKRLTEEQCDDEKEFSRQRKWNIKRHIRNGDIHQKW